tara:strand:- start:497 stop:1099 length:603 start_codon:yes stop_codon:yes gene_type:complete
VKKEAMKSHYSNSLPVLVAKGWLVETNEGYMLTPAGLDYYSVWSKTTKDKSEISKQIFSKTKQMDADTIQEILTSLLESKLVCIVYDPDVGVAVTKSTKLGGTVFKTIEYYVDTKRVNKDLLLEQKKINKAKNKVRNQKIIDGLTKGFEKSMFMATDMMVKIAKAQTGQDAKKAKMKKGKKTKPIKKQPPTGDMERMWKL